MKIHPLLNNPLSVLVYRASLPGSPSKADFGRAAGEVLELLQVDLEGEKVCLKPNATSGEHFADPELGIGTHPAFIEGMVAYLCQHGARRNGITIVEDPRNSDDTKPRHWRGTGYPELAEAYGVKLRSPNSYYCVRRNVPFPQKHAAYDITRYAVDPGTILINVPKLKTHNLAITTLCMKNLMGLVDVFDRHFCEQAWPELPEREDERPKSEWMDERLHILWQEGLARRLVDLAQAVKPRLNVVEGVIGRDGTGFRNGQNYPLGLVVAGINMVAVDSVASFMMGFDPLKLVYLDMAAGIGLGCNDPAQLQIYIAQEEELELCQDIEKLPVQPPFRVIRGILGETEKWMA